MSSNEALICAALSEGKIELDKELGLVIDDAYAPVRDDDSNQAGSMLGGRLRWLDYVVPVIARLYNDEDGQMHYTIYGAFDNKGSNGEFCIADHVPNLEDTPLNGISLSGAAIIGASKNDADLSAISDSHYPVCKGIQICAAVTGCDIAKKLLKGSADPALFIKLAWFSGSSGLDISLYSPTPIPLDLGNGIFSDPISFHLVLEGLLVPKLKVRTSAHIPVSGRKAPLHFMLEMELNETGGALTGHLSTPGGWNNPFDLSPSLTVGPDLLLSVSISYAGSPSGLGFVGGLQVGKVTGQVAFKVCDKPSEQLFSVEVGNTDLLDIVSLTRTVIQDDLPDPPNVITLNAFTMYACPFGVTLGSLQYPRGFSFVCNATFFGKNVDINVNIQKTGARLAGEIDDFKLGPFSVSGFNKSRPGFEIELSPKKQGGNIDGQIEFMDSHVVVFCHFDLTPKFIFEFDFEIEFADLFEFKVHGGPIPKECTTDSAIYLPEDYLLTASFHSQGRQMLAQRVDGLFQDIVRKERQDAEAAQEKLDAERVEWEAKIGHAQAELDGAHAVWHAKQDHAKCNHEQKERETRENVDRLKGEMDGAVRNMDEEVSKAQEELCAAQHERDVQVGRDEDELKRTRDEWDEKLNNTHRDLDDATNQFQSNFGYAQRDIEDANNKVNGIQGEINHIRDQIDDCNNAPWHDLPKKGAITGLGVELAALEAGRGAAEGALNAAKGIVASSEFVASEGGVGAAQGAVDAAQEGAQGATDAAVGVLKATKDSTRKLVEAAEATLEDVKRVGEEAVGAARAALEAGEQASSEILKDAQAQVDMLGECGERIEYEAKKNSLDSLQAAKTSGSDTLQLAKDGVVTGQEVKETIGHWISEACGSIVEITDVELSLEMSKAFSKCAFDAYVKGSMKGEEFELRQHFDPRNAEQWIIFLFESLVDKLHKEILPRLDENHS